jgi:lysophospholipase L1-like esterase
MSGSIIRTRIVLFASIAVWLGAGAACIPAPSKPTRQLPLRLYSIGDSITTGFDSYFIGDNPAVSWVNGFHGFLEQLLGIPDISSHNQRITDVYGSSGRTNVMEAQNGARWDDAFGQAQGVVAEQPTYVTIALGGNDVCRNSIGDLPSVPEIEGHVTSTLDFLDANLPGGATVAVVSIPDVKNLHDVALAEKGLLGIDCQLIWATTVLGFPCGSMLSPTNSEADRLFVQSMNFAYNDAIHNAVIARNATSQRVYYHFIDVEAVPFGGDDISSIDCFHPSADGQERISEEVWNQGPFGP